MVFKRFAIETLMDAIRTVASGNAWLPASLHTHMAERLRERQANRFAAELLMPEVLVEQEVASRGADPVRLACQFAVSDLAMGFRLVNLGYLEALPVDLDQQWQEWKG